MRIPFHVVAVFSFFLSTVGAAFGQAIVFDWQGGGNLQSWPSTIVKTQPVPFSIRNTNNLMYTYGIAGSCTQNAVDPWGAVSPILTTMASPQAAPPQPGSCDAAFTQATSDTNSLVTVFTAFRKHPETNTGCSAIAPCRIPLNDALILLQQDVNPALATAKASVAGAINACQADVASLAKVRALAAQVDSVGDWASASHTWQGSAAISPDSSCTFAISETYQGIATTPAKSVTFTAGQPRMTLSAGPLFSEVQDRSYSVVTTPPATGSSTNQTVLQVKGISKFSPYLVGLLNFAVPVPRDWWNGESGGLAISTGPVVRVGSQTTASPFGWFVGGSYHVYHLFYVSAGAHIGSFSDFPAGFTANGQTVPSGFPTPVGISRTSTRFAFALTFKASNLSALGKTAGTAKASQ